MDFHYIFHFHPFRINSRCYRSSIKGFASNYKLSCLFISCMSCYYLVLTLKGKINNWYQHGFKGIGSLHPKRGIDCHFVKIPHNKKVSSIFNICYIPHFKRIYPFYIFYKFYYFDRQFCESLWYTLGACNDYVSQSTRTLMSLLKENLHLITFIMCILVFFMFIF